MVFSELTFYSLLRCPECGGKLNFVRQPKPIQAPIRDAVISCANCDSQFYISAYVPMLLPGKISAASKRIIEILNQERRTIRRDELVDAQEWVAKHLSISIGRLSGDQVSACRGIAAALRVCREFDLNLKETHELIGILGSHLMSPGYKRYVADQMYASIEAVSYEKYEDIILRAMLNGFLIDTPVILIELGSGVGRLLHQYGSCISGRIDAAIPYRRHLPLLYEQHSIAGIDNLKFILGMDFEWRMIKLASRWLREERLYDHVEDGRISQVLGSTLHPPLSFEGVPNEDTIKIVCILFQTLGNQTLRELQIDMIRKAWQLASPNGIVLVSVFNAKSFEEQAPIYYSSIRKSVGSAIYCRDGVFFSSKAVYSKWFDPDELKKLFGETDIRNFIIYDNDSLVEFPEYSEYLNLQSQRLYKKRALIGVACSKTDQLMKVRNLIESRSR